MMKILNTHTILTLCLLGLSAFTHAATLNDFQGRWSGSGTATWHSSGRNRDVPCSVIYFHLNAPSSSLFEIVDGGYNCDNDLEAHYPNSQFEVRGDQLFYSGKNVGKITATGISIQVIDKEEGYAFDFELSPTKVLGQQKMLYTEKWRELNSNVPGALKLSIQGELEAQ